MNVDFKLSPAHMIELRQIKTGADINSPRVARILRDVQAHRPELIDIGKTMGREYGVDEKVPFFGAILTSEGKALVDSTPVTLGEIEAAAEVYADYRKMLKERVEELNTLINKLHREYMPDIHSLVNLTTEAELDLEGLIKAAPGLFKKPRTVVLHGVKVGYQKGKGGIDFSDADKVVQLIHKHYKDAPEALLHITEKPDKDALAKLSVDELKKLGCTVVATDDVVVIKSSDSAIDKLVAALIKASVEETKEEVA